MAKLLKRLNPEISAYRDRRFEGDEADWERAMRTSVTIYVGNLSFYTREEQIYEVFSKVGDVDKIIMGLDKRTKTPCGFCFVIYYTRKEAEDCVKYLNGMILDERPIRADHDWGYVEGRQWGRGRSGGQVRDEFRVDYDPDRGGYGRIMQTMQLMQTHAPTTSTASPQSAGPGGERDQHLRRRLDGSNQGGRGGRGYGRGGIGRGPERDSGEGGSSRGGAPGQQEARHENPRFRADDSDKEED